MNGLEISLKEYLSHSVRVEIARTRARRGLTKALSAGLAVLLVCAALGAQKQPPARPIDINVATIKELEELPGVGPVTAQKIIDMRQKSGRFRRVEDLLAIRGMSTKRLEALRPYITVSPPLPPPSPPSPPKKK
jgi:competence ComEA-like helix-hairpin-helix protein